MLHAILERSGRCKIRSSGKASKNNQNASCAQKAKLASLLGDRVWERKLSSVPDTCNQEHSPKQMKQERAQDFVDLQQTKQNKEGWQVLCQVALSLQ